MNKSGITTVTAGTPKSILYNPHLTMAVSVIVGNTGVVADADGNKIIPAGTPIGGATSALATRNTVLQVTNDATNGSKTQGITLCDIDVTNGNANANMLIFGFVKAANCPAPADASVSTALAGKITYIAG